MRKATALLRLLFLGAACFTVGKFVNLASLRGWQQRNWSFPDAHGQANVINPDSPAQVHQVTSTQVHQVTSTQVHQVTSTQVQQVSPTAGTRSPTSAPSAVGRRPALLYNASASIPMILHQTFSSELLYENYKPLINSCLSLNPNWTYYLWRDRDAEALIVREYPEFLRQYRRYRDGLERSDSIRYIVLHHFGGIYLDMDVECRQPFYPALSDTRSFLDQERIEQTNIFWGWPFSVMNSAMGAAPGHPFFRFMIDEMSRVSGVGNAFYSTGPALLTRVYNKYAKSNPRVPIQLLDPRVMSPLMDRDKNWRLICSHSLAGAAKKPDASRSWKERGCLKLQAKNWAMDDTDNSTVCVHRFLHLGYLFAAAARKRLFNVTNVFWPRLHFYS